MGRCPEPVEDEEADVRWCMKRGMAMFTSPDAHHCLLLAVPRLYSEVKRNLQQTQHSSFFKVDSPSAPEQEAAASAARSTVLSRLPPQGLTGGETGVFHCWD